MDPRSDPTTIWSYLKEGLDDIMSGVDIPYLKYTSLYSTIFNYCTMSRLVPDSSQDDLLDGQSPKMVSPCPDLYNRMNTYYSNYVSGLKNQSDALQGEEFLQYYAAQWSNYTSRATYANRLFTYFNRNWVKQELDKLKRRRKNAHKSDPVCEESKEHVYPIYVLALVQWKSQFLAPQHQLLIAALLHLVEDEREGGKVDKEMMKKITDSMASVGIDPRDSSKTNLDVYRELFETPFLEATEQYYAQKSATVRKDSSSTEYLKWVEERLRDEENRVEEYLSPETRKPLIELCELILSVKGSDK